MASLTIDITYNEFIEWMKNNAKRIDSRTKIVQKKCYTIILLSGNNYHVTIFEDQWMDYEKTVGPPMHLFHVSSNDELARCSIYYWLSKDDHVVLDVPADYFAYEQAQYNFRMSTRKPCCEDDIQENLNVFQKLVDGFVKTISA